ALRAVLQRCPTEQDLSHRSGRLEACPAKRAGGGRGVGGSTTGTAPGAGQGLRDQVLSAGSAGRSCPQQSRCRTGRRVRPAAPLSAERIPALVPIPVIIRQGVAIASDA